MPSGWTEPMECIADFTGDGQVTALDVQSLMPLRVCDAVKIEFDYSGDDKVDINDAVFVADAMASNDLDYDLNGDGIVDQDDILTLLTHVCGANWKGDGENPFDINEDGVVDDLDLAIVEQYLGIDECPCTLPPANSPS